MYSSYKRSKLIGYDAAPSVVWGAISAEPPYLRTQSKKHIAKHIASVPTPPPPPSPVTLPRHRCRWLDTSVCVCEDSKPGNVQVAKQNGGVKQAKRAGWARQGGRVERKSVSRLHPMDLLCSTYSAVTLSHPVSHPVPGQGEGGRNMDGKEYPSRETIGPKFINSSECKCKYRRKGGEEEAEGGWDPGGRGIIRTQLHRRKATYTHKHTCSTARNKPLTHSPITRCDCTL